MPDTLTYRTLRNEKLVDPAQLKSLIMRKYICSYRTFYSTTKTSIERYIRKGFYY